MERRHFLQQSTALILAGATAPWQEWGMEDPIRVALVGCGGRGSDLIRKLSTIEMATLVAVCDDYPPHLQRGQEAAGSQARAYADYAKMLKEIQPQAVVIATPLYLHYEMALAAIEAGCAVFCEKTMCYSPDQAKQLTAKVQASGQVFQVGLQRRANAIYRQAKAMIDAGMLGRITAIKAQWHRNNNWRRPVPVPKGDTQWKTLERRLNWRLYRDFSQGLMAELGSHQLDVANWMLGTLPARVQGFGGTDYWRDGREVFDNIFCTYEYELHDPQSGPYTLRATYSSIQSNAFEGASELIMGDKGSLYLTSGKGLFYQEKGVDAPEWGENTQADKEADIITSGKTLKLSNDPWAHRGKPFEIDPTGDDTREQLIAFLQSVAQKDPETICNARAGWEDTLTALSGATAMRERTTVEITL